MLDFFASTLKSVEHFNLYADLPGYVSPSVLTGDELRPDLLITLENKCIYILELTIGFNEECTKYCIRKIIKTCIRSTYYILCKRDQEWNNQQLMQY